jgi:hypothetical protein
MTDWTNGTVANIDTAFSYYSELNPQRLRLAFLNVGLYFPEVGTACELGFGQGVSVNLHAAASVVQWFGTDVNPAQTQFAQTLAKVSGTNAQLFDDAFAEFCQRTDLPEFDYIALHGVWSSISDENRAVIVDFLHRKLKVGGVVYISYNTQAGWAAMMPVRDLLAEYVNVMGSRGQGSVAGFNSALSFADQLLATSPFYAQINPAILEQIALLKTNSSLVNEYLNEHWQALCFSRTAQLLSAAKLSFACSAYYLDHVDALNLTDEQQELLNEIPDPLFRETVQDFCTNQAFRRDYWIKGAVRLNEMEQTEALCAARVVLVQARADVSFKVSGALGESTLHEAIYNPILDVLSDYQVKTLAQIAQLVGALGINLDQVIQVVMVLVGAGVLCPAQDEVTISEAKTQTDRINRYLCHKARGNSELSHLASPVTGGGIAVSRFWQLFLLAKAQGHTQPEHWARFAWSILAIQNQFVLKDGVALSSESESITELLVQAYAFANKNLPILIALGVCD